MRFSFSNQKHVHKWNLYVSKICLHRHTDDSLQIDCVFPMQIAEISDFWTGVKLH